MKTKPKGLRQLKTWREKKSHGTSNCGKPKPLASLQRQPKRSHGFTLIELMITVVILSLLTLVAIPSYTKFVTKARRADGQALLLDMAARQERYYYDNSAFTQTLTAIGYGAASNVASLDGHYTASAVNDGCAVDDYTSGECYVLKAVPQGDQAVALDGDLFLTFSGEKWRGTVGQGW